MTTIQEQLEKISSKPNIKWSMLIPFITNLGLQTQYTNSKGKTSVFISGRHEKGQCFRITGDRLGGILHFLKKVSQNQNSVTNKTQICIQIFLMHN